MKNKTFVALEERPFFFLWIGEIFTQIPTNLFNFLLILIVFNITNSNTAVSGIVLSFTVPAIFFGSVAGVYVDRWDKKKVIIITNILRAILLFILTFFMDNLIAIYAVSLITTILVQFFIPAETPMIPLIVKPSNLLSANALFGMAIFGSILAAYMLSGPALLFFTPREAILMLAFMLLIGAFFVSLIQIKNKTNKEADLEPKNFMKDVRHMFSLISKTKKVAYSLFLLSSSQILTLIVATVAPGYAKQILNIRIEDFPILFAIPSALGMVVGAIILVNIFHNHPKKRVISLGIFLSGISMMLLPYGSNVASRDFVQTLNQFLPHLLQINILHMMVVLAFILGIANAFVFVSANTTLQETTTDEVRGKIYGFLNSIIGLFSLLPIILAGGLSDIIGVGAVITGIGACLLVLWLVWMYTAED
jgi:MFS family permease